jgi:hypothetical protein
MFEFFRVWLIVLGAGIVVGGVAISLLGGTRASALLDRLIDPIFWTDGPDAGARRYQAWANGVLGGTMAGWGVMITLLVSQAYGTRQAWVWWTLALSTALWYVLDTGQSLRYRVLFNVALNTALLVALAIPLAFTFGEFH